MKQTYRWLGILTPVLLLAAGCETVRYTTYDFEWISWSSPGSMHVDVVTTGTSAVVDSAGTLIERRASPYRVGIYIDRQGAAVTEVLDARLQGERTGAIITPDAWFPADMGAESRTQVFVAPAVDLPFEDYRVEVRVRIGQGAGARDTLITARLRTRFEQRRALRFWEELMSV